jgi:hypothetical protein
MANILHTGGSHELLVCPAKQKASWPALHYCDYEQYGLNPTRGLIGR